MLERLQKIIARAGVASRRRTERLILSGQVTLNGRVILELGTKADPERDHIKVAGKLIRPAEKKIYLLLHKPDGVVATLSDPEGRRSLANLLHGVPGRVYPVGRLEYHASGLLLLTNDGELANLVMRAHSLPQTYWLKVKGSLNPSELDAIQAKTGVKIRRLKGGANAWYEATVTASSHDTLRRTLLQLTHPVEKLKRVKLSHLELASLLAGKYRPLTDDEVRGLTRDCLRAGLPARRPQRGERRAGLSHSKRDYKKREYRSRG
jgi:23S rRNA pseudouridine2605 synthase